MTTFNLLFTIFFLYISSSNIFHRNEYLIQKMKMAESKIEKTNKGLCNWDNCSYGGNLNLGNLQLSSGKSVRPFYVQGDNILCVTAALIADNAESSSYTFFGHSAEAILSIKIFGSNFGSNNHNDWIFFHSVPLPGVHYTGDEKGGPFKGYPKLEWLDCECLHYQNLGILDWDYFPYKYIRFKIEEGDKVNSDDTLLDIWGLSENYRNNRLEHGIWGSNYHHAAIWIQTLDYNY